jgi:DNA-directed RNA polymerase subunit RPC12/RpoP
MSQKYRQRGYRESEKEPRERSQAPPRRALTTEERIQRKSMRHAIDRDAKEVLRCHNCGRSIFDLGAVAQDSSCPHCSSPLHCCRNCTHFDSAARWQCRAEIQQQMSDKTRANTCGLFAPRLVLDSTGRRSGTPGGQSNDPRSQFENLFKRS